MKYDLGSLMKVGISIPLLIIFLYFSNPIQVIRKLTELNPFVYTLGVLIFLGVYPLSAYRWKILTENLVKFSFTDCLKIISISYGLNKILPLNSGDLARSKIANEYEKINNHGEILGTVGLERLLDVIVVNIIFVSTLLFYFNRLYYKLSWSIITALLVITGLIFLFIFEERLKHVLELLPNKFYFNKVKKLLKDSINGFNNLDSKQFVLIVIITAFRWFLDMLGFYVASMSLGLPVEQSAIVLLACFMTLISSLPITPAGAGFAEISGSALLVSMGYSNSTAGTLVIINRSLGLMLMGTIGIITINYEGFSYTFREN